MSSISSLGVAASGLFSAQKGLTVTGHNISNVNTVGYTRQQLLQHDTSYMTVGKSGGYTMQKGIGVSDTEIRQIRDTFADMRFRQENSVLSFYQTKSVVISEIETILDEPYGEGLSNKLDAFWSQTQKLSTNPSGIEERMAFLQAANVLIGRINQIQTSLTSYQDNLNNQVISTVNRVNELTKEIEALNELIYKSELNGDNANDYRDARNNALDELSAYMSITYTELPDSTVVVKSNGTILVEQGFVAQMELVQTAPLSPYVKPIWSDSKQDVYDFTSATTDTTITTEGSIVVGDTGVNVTFGQGVGTGNAVLVNASNGNDEGSLKSLLLARGGFSADKFTEWDDIVLNSNYSADYSGNTFLIPELQKQFDTLTHEIVSMVNECFTGEGLGTHEGIMGVPVFIPISSGVSHPVLPDDPTQEDIDNYNAELEQYYEDIKPYLTIGNIQVNPELLADSGYNKLGTVTETGNISDNTKVQEMLERWTEPIAWNTTDANGDPITQPPAPYQKTLDIRNFYAEMLSELGQEGYESASKYKEKMTVVQSIDNERMAIGSVSQDEELATMMKYQYAYNAASRMITMLDGMMDVIINKM
ncbi:MAG: flagellar hook-associated protein FlgK [Epulopiscium sp. Nuni2H_MBin003]|nr:MAG: flagellar hook-associated protein FlgK [Epulopiscium sp. Nuni2H_MBin003]